MVGGRSLLWGRQSYRWSDLDFGANARDGYGADWPIRYRELAPWYDHVESFVGIAGQPENMPQLPDGQFSATDRPELHGGAGSRRPRPRFRGHPPIHPGPGRGAHPPTTTVAAPATTAASAAAAA